MRYNNECFTFTAEHEEPCCGFCDYVCASQNICNHCGPEYGWCNYRRTVNIDDFTPLDEETYQLSIKYMKGEK